jgi:predicted MFS family arabinose efflux permease
MSSPEASNVSTGLRRSRGFILASLSTGHGLSHLYDLGLPAIMPTIASALGLSNFQVASLHGIRMAGFGAVNLGCGPIIDMLKRHWGLILTGCMFWAAAAFALVAGSPNYGVLVIGIIFLSVPGALWHLPATAALSQQFPDRRGFAISMHGFGSNIGNALGPLLAGALLGVIFWRYALLIYTGPALALAVFVWWSLRDLGREGPDEERRGLGSRFRQSRELLRQRVVVLLVLAATLRSVGLDALFHWTPFYLEEELGMGHLRAGFYLSLLTGMGVVSGPILGAISDKRGRKVVLVPGLVVAAALSLVVVSLGDSFALPLAIAAVGLFSFSLHHIMQAAVLDVAGRGTEATATGLIFGINGAVGAASPFVAAAVIDHLGGYGSVYYYAGIMTGVTAALVLLIPLRPPAPAPQPA